MHKLNQARSNFIPLFFYGSLAQPVKKILPDGTESNKSVIDVLLGDSITRINCTLNGYDLRFQPKEDMSGSVTQVLKKAWGENFLGGFSIEKAEEKKVRGQIYFIPAEEWDKVKELLAFWNFHGDWYEFTEVNGLVTEKIIDGQGLQPVPEGLMETREYQDFCLEMRRQAEAYIRTTKEGNHSPSKEN